MPAPASPPTVAAFDVDGTVTRTDCVVPFLVRIRGRWRLAASLLAHPVALARVGISRDRDAAKALAVGAALAGVPLARLEGEANDFADTVVRTGLRDDVLARLRWHRAAGHTVVLVSASLEVYLREIGRRIGADGVVGTRLEVDRGGICTGRLEGGNCRGAEKEVRLRTWLRQQGLDGAELWAYGDSAGDDELLGMADHPLRVDGIVVSAEPVAAPS